MEKIILTGTHCSGKTTLLNYAREQQKKGVICMDEMIRHLANIPNFRFTFDPEDTNSIMEYAFSEKVLTSFYKGVAEYGNIYPDTKLIIMDRCILDPLYYATYFDLKKTLLSGVTLRQSLMKDISFVVEMGFFKKSRVLLLKPLPLDLEDDFRLKGEEVQMGVYNIAKTILNLWEIPFEDVSQDEAKTIIEDSIRWYPKVNH